MRRIPDLASPPARRLQRVMSLLRRARIPQSGWSDDLPPLFGIGHNRGPKLYTGWTHYCWQQAKKRAFKLPPREVMLRRLTRAQALGMTYEEYTAIYLDTGKLL